MALAFQQSPTGTRKGTQQRDSLLTSPDGWFPFLELNAAVAEKRGQGGKSSITPINVLPDYMNNQELTGKRNKWKANILLRG